MVITLHCCFGIYYVVIIFEGVSLSLWHVQVEYLSILVTCIITSIRVLTYLFKLNIVFLYFPFTSQVGCLPSTSNQYSKLVTSCRHILLFSGNLDGFFNYCVICTIIYCIYVASTR
jgi:hypothetical protein